MDKLRDIINKRYKIWVSNPAPIHEVTDLIYGTGMIIEKDDCFIKEVIYDHELYDALKVVFPTVNFHFATIFITYPPPPEEHLILFEVEVFDIYTNSLRNIGL
jgi:hypothetical protein